MPADDVAKPILAVFTGDWHTNDTCGLCPPVYHREKLAEHRPGKAVRALWRAWQEFWQLMADKKQETGAELLAFCVGDLADINVHSQTQLISFNQADILRAMVDVTQPMLEVADRIFVIRGTASHTGGNGLLEELFAQDIGAEPCPDEDSMSWWVMRGMLGGVRVETSHHSPTYSMRPWTLNQAAARAAAIVSARYQKEGLARETPDVCVWAHRHAAAQGQEMGVHGFFLPSWKLVGQYGHRLGAGAHIEKVGGLWLLCQGGEYAWGWERWSPRRPTIWQSGT